MPAEILLVGAGQLGSRYLQGLAGVELPLMIHVVDPAQASLDLAQNRWEEVVSPSSLHEVRWTKQLDTTPTSADLAIIATTAKVRPDVVSAVSRHAKPERWILEKTLASSLGGVDRILESVGQAPAWVNTSRRSTDWYRQVSVRVGSGPFQIEVEGGPWGLVANGIHFLDLARWFSGQAAVSFDVAGLEHRWEQGKRPDSWEVFGEMSVRFADSTNVTLRVGREPGPLRVRIRGASGEWIVDETGGIATGPTGEQMPGSVPPQSVLTTPLVEGLLAGKGCLLPPLSQAAPLHRAFVEHLGNHWGASAPSGSRKSFIQ
jgi:hypothetical protein